MFKVKKTPSISLGYAM